MIPLNLFTLLLLSLACAPISWAVPRKYAFDAVAAWTLLCLLALSPASALWLLSISVVLPCTLSVGNRTKGAVASALCIGLIVCFVGSRVTQNWAWIGGAFFTLRAVHVVIEWWMGRLSKLSLRESLQYFLFLPVLPAGPINRLPHFLHQMRRRRWEPEMFMTGAERVLLGLIWIYVVASYGLEHLERDVIRATADIAPFWQLWSASAVSWVELFFVFAGATHLALGVSLMMGLRLEENFNRPWAARNLIEFWTRWHMSLTGWVQDYVFRPLTALTRQPVMALIVAMLVIGLWHEFSAYYVLWSFWQALGVVLSRVMIRRGAGMSVPTLVAAILGPLCVLAWLSAARPVIGALLGGIS